MVPIQDEGLAALSPSGCDKIDKKKAIWSVTATQMSQFDMCTVAFVTKFPDDAIDDPGNIVPNVTVTHKLHVLGINSALAYMRQTGSNMMQNDYVEKSTSSCRDVCRRA